MKNIRGNHWCKAALLAVVSGLALPSAPALAQTGQEKTITRELNVPPGQLGQTLIAISNTFGVDVVSATDLVSGRNAPAVSGVMTVEQALERALAGSGLQVRVSAQGAFVISAPGADAKSSTQASQRDESQALETIVVVGTKQGLTLQESDVSVEMFSEVRMERESIFTLDDLVLRTSNVTLGGNGDTITIRGIGRSGVGDAGQGVTSNVYLDGAPVSTEALQFGFDSLWDVSQVEVLRGPQSTLQGRNALAGAIVITTNDPSYDWEIAARIRSETFNTRQYAGVVSGPIIDEQLAFRIAVDHQETDGVVDNAITGNDQDFAENLLVRGKVLLEPNALPNLRSTLTVDYNDSKRGAPRSSILFPVAANDPTFSDFDVSDRSSFSEPFDSEGQALRIISDTAYKVSDRMTLRAIGTYEDNDTQQLRGDFNDLTQFPFAGDGGGDTTTYSAELRAEFDDVHWSGIVGVYYFEDDFDSDVTIAVPLASQLFFPVNPADSVVTSNFNTGTSTKNYAVYGQARFDLSPKWTLDFGIRYDYEEFTTPGSLSDTPSVAPANCLVTVPGSLIGDPSPQVDVPCAALVALFVPASDGTPQAADFDAILPRGGITYHVNDDLSLFASAQRGYRAGGTFLRQTSSGVEVGTFDPEYLTNVEIGFRSQWFEKRLTLNGNVFRSWLTDQQVVVPGPSGLLLDAETVNAGESTILGFELWADYQSDSGLNIYGSLGLLDTEFKDFPFAAPQGVEFDNLKGNEFPQAAPVSFTLGGSYEHMSGVFIDASVNYQGESESNITNLDEQDLGNGLTEVVDARTVVNIRVGYAHENYRITGYVTNLFDDDTQTRREFATVNTDGGAVEFDSNAGIDLPRPRAIGVQLDMSF